MDMLDIQGNRVRGTRWLLSLQLDCESKTIVKEAV
jgi:hypothetical protein